jgi:hypothetical protein
LSEIIIHTAKVKSYSKMDLDEIDVELEWIQGIREQVEFLNPEMKHHTILFRLQRRQFLMEGA